MLRPDSSFQLAKREECDGAQKPTEKAVSRSEGADFGGDGSCTQFI